MTTTVLFPPEFYKEKLFGFPNINVHAVHVGEEGMLHVTISGPNIPDSQFAETIFSTEIRELSNTTYAAIVKERKEKRLASEPDIFLTHPAHTD